MAAFGMASRRTLARYCEVYEELFMTRKVRFAGYLVMDRATDVN